MFHREGRKHLREVGDSCNAVLENVKFLPLKQLV